MCEVLGYSSFCAACTGSREESGELVCRDKNGRFYGLPVKQGKSLREWRAYNELRRRDSKQNFYAWRYFR